MAIHPGECDKDQLVFRFLKVLQRLFRNQKLNEQATQAAVA